MLQGSVTRPSQTHADGAARGFTGTGGCTYHRGLRVTGLGCALNSRDLLADVELEVVDGPLALLGPSGAGKSLVLRCLLGLAPSRSSVRGELSFNDGTRVGLGDRRALARLRGHGVCLLPQDAAASLDPVRRVEAQLRELLRLHGTHDMPELLLAEVGLPPPLLLRYPHELSGGQAQRVALALALACRPALLLADEPSAALDNVAQAQLLGTLRHTCNRYDRELVLVTHDIALASTYCARAVVLDAGRVVEAGPLPRLISAPVHPVTQALVAAARRADALFRLDAPPVLEVRS